MISVGKSAAVLLLAAAAVLSRADEVSAGDAALCLGCHDFGPDSPVHQVQAGSHGTSDNPEEMLGRRGCQDCHGDSDAHARAPTVVSPTVSYGPRWSATAAAQDRQCLACHEAGQAAHWKDALHMFNNLTCVTCHDLHAERDRVLFPDEQAQVCTTCHKAQKQGIHGLEEFAEFNPPCTSCHNPHDHESAQGEMLENGSAGCRSCHNLERMARSARVSDKVKGYHKAMLNPDNTCLDCHEGIAHAPHDAVTAMVPVPASERLVTLFYPGMADSDWLLQDHPGSQPLRQGRNCQQCHRGEEAAMGEAQAAGVSPTSRELTVAFSRDEDWMTVTLDWQGPPDDTDIALMWDDGGNDAFRRGGCFAACHSDLPGMSRDRGQHTGKYLWTSRSQQQRIGQPSLLRPAPELERLLAEGDFVELWRVKLATGEVDVAILLAEVNWQPGKLIQINKTYSNGHWTVALTAPLNNTNSLKPFTPDGKYTFGIALHGAVNPAGRHWVSLPLTMSFTGDETDFKVERQ
ncbi:MAG: cytochrome c3 family protein [Halieaceae bacterium]|jgi:predicted CXXCH cytochrome family protein|nr:cytochrome c3 family protein [Halieaceae bacterium]